MIWTGCGKNPDPILGRLSLKNDSLIQAERAIALLSAMTYNVKCSRLAEEKLERAITLAFAPKTSLRSEVLRLLGGEGKAGDEQCAQNEITKLHDLHPHIQHLN